MLPVIQSRLALSRIGPLRLGLLLRLRAGEWPCVAGSLSPRGLGDAVSLLLVYLPVQSMSSMGPQMQRPLGSYVRHPVSVRRGEMSLCKFWRWKGDHPGGDLAERWPGNDLTGNPWS